MSEEKNIPEENPKNQIPNSKQENADQIKLQQNLPEEKQTPAITQTQTSLPAEAAAQAGNLEPQTTNMETHAQHLHTAPGHGWKHYLFEFLMLFLAVFCGFLAENLREHIVEHNREKQFMQSMLEDLEKDALAMKNESELAVIQYTGLDSLTKIIYEGKLDHFRIRKMYELQRKYLSPLTLRLINRTELQLKNSGGMRLIRNRQVADSIIYYWGITELLYITEDNINIHREKAKDISFTLFSNKYYKDSEDWSSHMFIGEPELTTRNPAVLSEFANRVSHMRDLLKFNYKKRRLERQTGNAITLIKLIKNEYHLE
jgi:hypothetical protein